MSTIQEERWRNTHLENTKLSGHNNLLREKMRTIATVSQDKYVREIATKALEATKV